MKQEQITKYIIEHYRESHTNANNYLAPRLVFNIYNPKNAIHLFSVKTNKIKFFTYYNGETLYYGYPPNTTVYYENHKDNYYEIILIHQIIYKGKAITSHNIHSLSKKIHREKQILMPCIDNRESCILRIVFIVCIDRNKYPKYKISNKTIESLKKRHNNIYIDCLIYQDDKYIYQEESRFTDSQSSPHRT